MTNALQPSDRKPFDRTLGKHEGNMMTSLAHRLKVARANNNARLVTLLEQEQQVTLERSRHVVRSQPTGWETIAQQITQALFGGSTLQTCEVVDGRDRWWVASDPRTGQVVYADSEAEMRLWIKENYQGR